MSAPVKKITVGSVQAAIWENNAAQGNSYHTVSLDRRYKNKNDEWKSTNSFRVSDLPKAILALQKAYERLAVKDSEEGLLREIQH